MSGMYFNIVDILTYRPIACNSTDCSMWRGLFILRPPNWMPSSVKSSTLHSYTSRVDQGCLTWQQLHLESNNQPLFNHPRVPGRLVKEWRRHPTSVCLRPLFVNLRLMEASRMSTVRSMCLLRRLAAEWDRYPALPSPLIRGLLKFPLRQAPTSLQLRRRVSGVNHS